MGLGRRLYRGETQFPLIQRKKTFYAVSGLLVLIALVSMLFRGFNLGTEFKGGSIFQWPAHGATVSQARQLFADLRVEGATVQTVGSSSGTDLRVETPFLDTKRTDDTLTAISQRFPAVRRAEISPSDVGPAWGQQVTNKALQGLLAFLVVVIIYISIRFEPKMAVAAIIALIHDLVLAAGVYSLTYFVVTPATVIALLTVLGYSLYDTIVVFDRVEENTRGIAGGSRYTYGEAAELAVNQTFMRSINTSLIALLPVAGLLFVGAFLLGAGTLKDLSLALFVGLAAGAYSSLFLATPLLVDLKEREPQYRALSARVLSRRAGARAGGGGRFAQRAAARAAGLTGADDPAAQAAELAAAEGTAGAPNAATGTAGTGASAASAPRRPTPPPRRRKGGRAGRPSGKRRR